MQQVQGILSKQLLAIYKQASEPSWNWFESYITYSNARLPQALISAGRSMGDEQWLKEARRAFYWFLGENQLQQALYDDATGGCCDGLHEDRVNQNQGAESTLSFLLALLEMRAIDRTNLGNPEIEIQ